MTLARRAGADGMATALLAAAVVGSGIMGERLAGGNVAVALLANTLATAGALVALILTFGPISGAHMNPLVTSLARLRGEVGTAGAAAIIGAQLAGAIAGVGTADLMFGEPVFAWSQHARPGLAQMFAESVATCGLLLVVGLAQRERLQAAALAVGAYIAAAYWFTSSTAFANPALTAARALTDTFAGISPADVPAFLIGQIAGAAVALGLLRLWVPSGATYRLQDH